MVLSALVEGTEMGLVALVNPSAIGPNDVQAYFDIRNRPVILMAKVVYNLTFAVASGWICWRIAGGPMRKRWVLALAVVQTALSIWGAVGTAYSAYTPIWLWAVLTLGTGPAILLGGRLAKRRPNDAR